MVKLNGGLRGTEREGTEVLSEAGNGAGHKAVKLLHAKRVTEKLESSMAWGHCKIH